MSYYMDNGGGNDFDPGNTPKKSNTALIVVAIVFGCISLFCCLPFIGPALELVAGFKTEFFDELKTYDASADAVVIDVYNVTEVNSRSLDAEEEGYFFTYEYEFNGQKYRSSFPRGLGEHYRCTGDKVQLRINSGFPKDIYDPGCFEDPADVNYLLGHEPEYFNESVDAAVVDVWEIRQGDLKERAGDRSGYGYIYEYEFDGKKYQSSFPELISGKYRQAGDKAEIKVKSSSPDEFYDPDTLKVFHKTGFVILAVCIVVLLVPAIAVIAVIILVMRSARRKKKRAVVNYHYDSQEYNDPNDDYRG